MRISDWSSDVCSSDLYERQNQLDVALQEIGKIERTLFMLDWLENPDLRRRCHAGLKNGEQRHALTQAIYTFRQGRIIDRRSEEHTSELQSIMRISYAVICLKKNNNRNRRLTATQHKNE